MTNTIFSNLAKTQSTGEVVGINSLLARVTGLEGATVNSLILFEGGYRGLVRQIDGEYTDILLLTAKKIPIGTACVLEQLEFRVPVGAGLIGRVVSVFGEPLDGKGEIEYSDKSLVFAPAPGITEREALDTQLVTGVTIVDSLFPIVNGQRIAVLGDNKSGKSTFLRQLGTYQARVGKIVIYILIAKRQVDADALMSDLKASGAIKNSIVIVASSFEALSLAYIAPYVGCAIAEFLWQKQGRDVVAVFDDLSVHAKIYREISLLAEVSPGRDSYPGDMFYAHSSLLERAGKLAGKQGTLTALPIVTTPNDDITAYLPTSVMSITDGQIIFDLQSFRKGIRPAVNVGLSVSRVGGRVQSQAWKALSSQLFRKLADYRQAAEFSQFGSDIAVQTKSDLALGKLLHEIYKQPSIELYDINAQFLILSVAIANGGRTTINTVLLKRRAMELKDQVHPDLDPQPLVLQLLQEVTIQVAE